MNKRPVIGDQTRFHAHHCDICGRDCFILAHTRCEVCGRWFSPEEGQCVDICPRCVFNHMTQNLIDAIMEAVDAEEKRQ